MKIHFSLRNTLATFSVVITVVPIFIIGYVGSIYLTRYVTEDITNKNLLTANYLSGQIQTTLKQSQVMLQQLAQIIDQGASVNQYDINQLSESILSSRDELEQIRVLDTNAIVTHIAPFNRNYLGINMSNMASVTLTSQVGISQWSSTFISPQTRQPTVSLSVPSRQGMIIGYLNLKTLQATIDNLKIGALGYAFIVDKDGTFIAHPEESLVAEQLNLRSFPILFQKLSQQSGMSRFELDGVDVFSSSVTVPQTDWTITIIQPVDEALMPVYRIRNTIFMGMLFTLIVSVFLVLTILKKILRPLVQLTKHSQRISAGDDSYLAPQKSYLEVNELTNSFTIMIDSLKSRESLLRDSMNKAQYYLDVAGVILLVIDSNRKVSLINKKGCDVLGYQEEEIIGRDWVDHFMPERHKAQVIATLEKLKTGTTTSAEKYENNVLRKDGAERIVEWHNVVLKNDQGDVIGTISSGEDITERKQMEAVIRNESQRLYSLIEAIPASVYLQTPDYAIKYANRMFLETFGDPEGKTCHEILRYQITPCETCPATRVIETGRPEKWEWTSPEGKNYMMHDVPFSDFDGSPLILVIGIDITERKLAEDQIKASLTEKEILIQEIHHRVKNNMQVIIGLLDLQSGSTDDERLKSSLQESQSRVHALAAIHETLHESDNMSEIDLKNYLQKLTNAIFGTYLVEPGRITLKNSVEDVHITIKQASTLGLVLNELISNSLKYAFPKNTTGEICVGMKKSAGVIDFSVMDNGIGFPIDLEWRNSKSLGLKLVRSLVEAQLGGSILMESDKGTKFTIKFKSEG